MTEPLPDARAELPQGNVRVRKRAGDRIDELLDVADAQINASRSAMVSMRAVGEAASASRALVYAYFADQYRLLDAVLARHVAQLREAGVERVSATGALLERCRACADIYLRHIADHGMALEIVMRDPEFVRGSDGAATRFRSRLYRRLATAAARELRMSAHEALTLVQLLMVIPGDAGRLVHEGELQRDEAFDLSARLIASSLAALRPSG